MRLLAIAAMLPSAVLAQMPAGPATLVTGQKSVGDAPVQIVAARPRVSVDVTVDGGSKCFFGPAGTTTSTGYPLRAGKSLFIPTSAAVWAVCATPATVGFSEIPVIGGLK